jgi:hypothetical protein
MTQTLMWLCFDKEQVMDNEQLLADGKAMP